MTGKEILEYCLEIYGTSASGSSEVFSPALPYPPTGCRLFFEKLKKQLHRVFVRKDIDTLEEYCIEEDGRVIEC